jgi:hypothetical protein
MFKQGTLFTPFMFLPFVLMLATGCIPKRHDGPSVYAPINMSVQRFENDLFSTDPSVIPDSLSAWKARYGIFLSHYSAVLKLGDVVNPGYAERLKQFSTDRSNYLIYKRTMEVFPDLDTFEYGLTEAFRNYHGHFPEKPLPRIITYVSGLTQSAITDDSLLAIGLDKYLGTEETLYKEIGLYRYLTLHMYPRKLVSDCMAFWGETEFPFHDSINSLVTNMVYRGRLLYFTREMVPSEPDTVNWGFTTEGLAFCRKNEQSMWTNLIENKLLFNTDRFTIDKFMLEGPFTKDFGRESPSRAAIWTGMRIVESYMDKNPDITLAQLMEEKDYMKILNLSAYNP